MKKVKICGLTRPEDINAVNTAKPDYCGFIIDFPKSRRSISSEYTAVLSSLLLPSIIPAGVFVDAPITLPADLANRKIIQVIQLHGHEDNNYIKKLKALTDCEIWQAFQVSSDADIKKALNSSADLILLDAGQGCGSCFNWSLLDALNKPNARPYALAGGLNAGNIRDALKTCAILFDVSGGVETDGHKDKEKIQDFVNIIRNERKE